MKEIESFDGRPQNPMLASKAFSQVDRKYDRNLFEELKQILEP